jgi:hypothetical protein
VMLYGMSPTNVFMRTIKPMRQPLGRHLFSLKITQGFLPSSKSTTPPISFTATQILLQGEVCRWMRVARLGTPAPVELMGCIPCSGVAFDDEEMTAEVQAEGDCRNAA